MFKRSLRLIGHSVDDYFGLESYFNVIFCVDLR